MAKWISTATCAAAVLSVAVAAAPNASAQTAKSKPPQSKTEVVVPSRQATLSGCVVRDAANAGQPTISSNGISYKLTGKSSTEFTQYLGKRVEVTGALSAGSTSAVPTTGRSKTEEPKKTEESKVPEGLTAVGGQSDVTATGVARDNTAPADQSSTDKAQLGGTPRQTTEPVPLATDRGTTADLTGQMQVKTLKVISPNCL